MSSIPRGGLYLMPLFAVAMLVLGIAAYRLRAESAMQKEITETPRDPKTGIVSGVEGKFYPADGKNAVLFLHGFIASPKDFADLPECMRDKGFAVSVPLLPGHGTRPDALSAVTAETLYEFAKAEYLALRAEHAKVFVVGFSMGGALAAQLACDASLSPPEGVVLVSPFFGKVPYRFYYLLTPRLWTKCLMPVLPAVLRSERFIKLNKRENLKNIFAYHSFPVAFSETLFEVGDRSAAPEALSRFRSPVLFLVSAKDGAASPETSKKIFDLLPVKEKTWKLYKRSNHILLWDYDAEEAKAEAEVFFTLMEEETRPFEESQ